MKTFAIKTLGCKVNQYESQIIREQFLSAGLKEISFDSKLSDIYVINTCTVTRESDRKSLKFIRDKIKVNNSMIIATGCLTEMDEETLRRIPEIIIVKNRDKNRIAELLDFNLGRRGRGGLNLPYHASGGITYFKGHSRAFVKIQDGCDNLCSYCKVRLVRGRSLSRRCKEIIEEVNALVEKGFQEIVLTGICLGSYGRDISDELNLCRLLREILKNPTRFRVRLSSIEPGDITYEFIELIRQENKLCKHLHIPFQSGDNTILKRMNRPYTREFYLSLIERLRNAISDIAITTDIMVGFPGETDKEFENTVGFLEEVQPSRTHIFPFSRREGTPAYNFSDYACPSIIRDREERLFELTNRFSYEYAERFENHIVEVLVEDKRGPATYFLKGYTDRYIKVHFKGPETLKGKLVTCLVSSTPPFLTKDTNISERAGLTNPKTYGILMP